MSFKKSYCLELMRPGYLRIIILMTLISQGVETTESLERFPLHIGVTFHLFLCSSVHSFIHSNSTTIY